MKNIYKKLFLATLSISLLSLSSCVTLPEEKVGIDPIFIEEKNEAINEEKIQEKTEEINNQETVTETSSGEILNSENIKTSTGDTLEENTETGEILNTQLQTKEEAGIQDQELSKIENITNTGSTSTGEIILESSTGENL